jgi:6-phosphogluconolactonase
MASYHLITAETDELVAKACAQILKGVKAAIDARGQASLMVSGGSSPKPLFAALSLTDIDWDKVTVSLVDERWVEPGEAGSNESFIKDNFLQGAAANANFISLKSAHDSVSEGLSEIERRFAHIPAPFDICVMGMGTDSHTASWFPGAVGREAAMDEANTARFAYVDARGCDGAGEFPDRITLTLSAVMASRDIILFIPGAQKAKVFDVAQMGDEANAPVGALKSAGEHLTVFTGHM